MSTTTPPTFLPPAPPPERPERPEGLGPRTGLPEGSRRWPWWNALLAPVTAIFGIGVLSAVVLAATGNIDDPSPEATIGLTYLQDVAFIGVALLFASFTARPIAADFGLRRSRFWRSLAIGFGVGVGFYVLTGIYGAAVGIEDQEQTTLDDIGALTSDTRLVLSVVLVTVMAPIAEELFFRGFLFPALRNAIRVLPAALIVGIAFGAIHAGSSPVKLLVPLAIFGFGLCLLYHWTGSLYPPIALHALNNAVAFSVGAEWTVGQGALCVVAAMVVSVGLAKLLARALGDRRPAAVAAPVATP